MSKRVTYRYRIDNANGEPAKGAGEIFSLTEAEALELFRYFKPGYFLCRINDQPDR